MMQAILLTNPLNKHMPLRDRVTGDISLLFLQLVTQAIPAAGLCTHVVLKVCASYFIECIFHTT